MRKRNIEKAGFQYYFGYRNLTFMDKNNRPISGMVGRPARSAFLLTMGINRINYS